MTFASDRALLTFDLGVLHRDDREIEIRESLLPSGGYIAMGLAFGAWVWSYLGAQSGLEYLTGFLVEKTLAMDNVFVIAMIFPFFAVPREYQHRVLFWGIVGVIVLRAIMIGLGTALVTQFSWVLYLFAFLMLTGINTYTGATTITAGTHQLGGGGSLSGLTALMVAGGAIFDVNGTDETIGTLTGPGTVQGGGTLRIADALTVNSGQTMRLNSDVVLKGNASGLGTLQLGGTSFVLDPAGTGSVAKWYNAQR